MSQVTNYTVDNAAGNVVRADVNSILDAVKTNNSGGSDPSNPVKFMFYGKSSDDKLKVYDGSNFREIGDVGEQGETGECQINCRDKIGYDIIINAIKNRLKENEAMKNGRNPFSAIQRKINDNIRYYDNMNLPSTEIIVKLKEKYKKELNDKTNQENQTKISSELGFDRKFGISMSNCTV